MFEEIESFDQAYGQAVDGGKPNPVPPLRRRKTLSQRICFWGANAVFLPLVALCYLSISAEGLRRSMSALSLKIYQMPVPGADYLRDYSGWNRIDLSMLMALLLFISVTYIWYRTCLLLITGELTRTRHQNPVLFSLLAFAGSTIVLGDLYIFYYGLESKASSSWHETPKYVPAIASIVYMSGLAMLGFFHADHHTSGTV